MRADGLLALSRRWREDAETLRRRGADAHAAVWELAADELDAFMTAWHLEELDLEAAAAESGYTRSAIEKMLRRGDLANAGQKGRPSVRRCDLPCKPGSGQDAPDLAELVWASGGGR